MLTMLNVLLQTARDQRGVVSVEWILLGSVIIAAIVAAFAPAFTTMLSGAVAAISAALTAQLP